MASGLLLQFPTLFLYLLRLDHASPSLCHRELTNHWVTAATAPTPDATSMACYLYVSTPFMDVRLSPP